MEAIRKPLGPPGALADSEVVERVVAGEKGLYEILMRRYNRTLYRAVRSYLREVDDVQDAMQEAWIKAYVNLGRFQGDSAFSTWLVRIGINEALQHLRKERRMQVHKDPDARSEHLVRIPDNMQMDPEQRTIQDEHRRLLEQAIDRLPEGYRAVYMLREVEGLGVADVASALELSESNVKVRLHRAKALLKEAIWQYHHEVPAFEFGNAHCDRLVEAVMARI